MLLTVMFYFCVYYDLVAEKLIVRMLEKMETIDVDQVIEEFETITKDAEKIQRETLKKILEENGSAEYLQNLGLNGRTDPESYKACVPLVSHPDLEPYIRRIADGDSSNILTGKAITTMSLRYILSINLLLFHELN